MTLYNILVSTEQQLMTDDKKYNRDTRVFHSHCEPVTCLLMYLKIMIQTTRNVNNIISEEKHGVYQQPRTGYSLHRLQKLLSLRHEPRQQTKHYCSI